jgi:hypothetical protein
MAKASHSPLVGALAAEYRDSCPTEHPLGIFKVRQFRPKTVLPQTVNGIDYPSWPAGARARRHFGDSNRCLIRLKVKHPVRLENSKSLQLLEATRQSGSSVRDADRPRPDHLNALEEVFTKFKSLLRDSARTAETTWRCIGERLEAFALQERANCLRKPGYAWN